MAEWLVKNLSKLTGVSVQTLHHYDQIGLLKPSLRLPNGYRLYSEKDLLRLQKIIALKFLGFKLSEIKALLTASTEVAEHFKTQAKLLEKKAHALLDASRALKVITTEFDDHKSIPWKTIIELIEVYRMTETLKNAWVKEILLPEELKEYIDFETGLKHRFTPEQKEDSEKKWAHLVAEIEDNLQNNPKSEVGIAIGRKCMAWLNELYGKDYAHLRTQLWEKGLGQGIGLENVGLTSKTADWLDKAIDAYWRDRIYTIFDKIGSEADETILNLWKDVLGEMYGNDDVHKKELYDIALADEKVSEKAKKWIKTIKE